VFWSSTRIDDLTDRVFVLEAVWRKDSRGAEIVHCQQKKRKTSLLMTFVLLRLRYNINNTQLTTKLMNVIDQRVFLFHGY